MEKRRIRVLITKVGLDGHDRGAKLVARALMDAGMEVIYTGIRQSVESTVNAAVEEDVDVIGLSFLSGDHMALVPKLLNRLIESGRDDMPVVVGGIILKRQIPDLMQIGVRGVFLPGTPMDEITDYIQSLGNEKL